MESKRGTQVIRFNHKNDFELTIEGIQLLQSVQSPIGIVSVVGPPSSGKTKFCYKLLGVSQHIDPQSTLGIWAWGDTLKVIKREDDGTEYKSDILIFDCEAVVGRSDNNKTRGLELLTLACLISSHIIYFSNEPLHTQNMQDLDIFAELPNVIRIQKHLDSFKSLHEFLPTLTWVIYGPDLKAPEDSAGAYLEKILSKQTGSESSKIKASLKAFFRNRNCFNVVEGNKSQHHRLIEFIQQVTPVKKIFNVNLSGPILCSILQTYVGKLQKKAPCVIQSAFTRAVAAECRKKFEKLYVSYLENMSEIENKLPCSEEELWKGHNELSKFLLERFDQQMTDFGDCEEVIVEKNNVIGRMKNYFEELKEANYAKSEDQSKKVFEKEFEVIKEEDVVDKITEVEEKLLNAVNNYYENSKGPASYKVFVTSIINVFPFLCGVIREFSQQIESNHDDLLQEIENLKKNREKARQNEKKLQEILNETIKSYESQLINKENFINEIQTASSNRISASELKIKNLSRELKSLQQELEHSLSEKQILLDAEHEIFNKKAQEYEEIIEKLKQENARLQQENEEFQIIAEKSISDKDSKIIELIQKEKLSENFEATVVESKDDQIVLNGLKTQIADIFNYFANEQSNNAKMVSQLDQIAYLQSELNQYKLKEIENQSKIADEYEEKIENLNDQIERMHLKIQSLEKNKSFVITDSGELETVNKKLEIIEEELRRKNEENCIIKENLAKRDEQIENLYSVIEVHKKQFEKLEMESEDNENELHRIKIEFTQINDDNDILLGLMGYSLEVLQKKRNIQAINLAQIKNQSNRNRVIKIFKKFGIPFD